MGERRIILDLCGGTGAWSRPYAEAGYDVLVVTLPEQDVRTYEPPDGVYGILAAPPCTMFSLARTTAKTPRNTRQGMETVEACLHIIWECHHRGKPKWWALENPKGLLRHFLGKPALTFDPCDYGDAYTKRTDVWGRFHALGRNHVPISAAMLRKLAINNRPLPNVPGGQSARRAVTPPGFARAFFLSNP
jgi:site-specific DNA-cytosine methylase